MKKLILILILILALLPNITVAANKQFLVPGYGYTDQKEQDEQWQIPGYGYIDEEPVPAADGGETTQVIFIGQLLKQHFKGLALGFYIIKGKL